jgi:hypothetical protein
MENVDCDTWSEGSTGLNVSEMMGCLEEKRWRR